MKYLLTAFFVAASYCLSAQPSHQKNDSVAGLVQLYFNEKDHAKLYDLTGESFRKAITAETFQTIGENNLFILGRMSGFYHEKTSPAGVSKYKAVFDSETLGMYLSLDEKGKLSTFLFKPYVDETATKTTAVSTSNPLTTFTDKKVDSVVKSYMSLSSTAGLSIGILKDGKVHFYGYGETTKGNKQIPDQNTLFEIGSISKTFTAILLADAVNAGKIKLDDPVNKYLPKTSAKLEYDGVAVTIRMMSNHTSGLPRMSTNFDDNTEGRNPYRNYDKQRLLDFYKTIKLERKPGTVYEYSNFAVATLGIILENLYKKTFEQLVMEKITGPLQMNHTRQFLRKQDSAKFAHGYDEKGDAASQWDFKAYAAAGALRSTAEDMLKYAKAVLGEAPSSLSKAIQLTIKETFNNGEQRVGLGWHFYKPGKDELIMHSGGTGGYRSIVTINKNRKQAVVILSNSAIGPEEMALKLMVWLEQQ
jgi:CubicO group peptidase (beta-lactamase class C family)